MMPVSRYVDTRYCLAMRLIQAPTNTQRQPKMIYASSKEALKRSLTGIATELQANDTDDIEYDSILKTVSKGLAG